MGKHKANNGDKMMGSELAVTSQESELGIL